MTKRLTAICVALLVYELGSSPVRAERLSQCTVLQLCYCVDTELNPIIEDRVTKIRKLIADERKQGKLIGYISTPLSNIEGSYFDLNRDVAKDVKTRLEAKLGSNFVWMLNPGAEDLVPEETGLLPANASGADYMWMWTRILEGQDGLGSDLDWFYFVGPTDFAKTLKLTGTDDMQTIDTWYDKHATDPKLKSIGKMKFRAYYGLRAAVSFSYGSHDEWNIARAIDARRRAADLSLGIAEQLGIYFDGAAVAPALFETPVVPGTAVTCAEK